MKVTVKGQVTIPQHIREKLNITPHSEVDFISEGDQVYLVKSKAKKVKRSRFSQFRGVATANLEMTTDEIMALMRGEE